MSTTLIPLEIPAGVVGTATKKMRSSNYAEVNMVRWTEKQLSPIGGQSKFGYSFASICRAIHAWTDLASIYHIAYVCETNVYIDTGGALTEITPTGGLTPPSPPGTGGYGDLSYGDDTYGTPRASSLVGEFEDMPPCYSVDNFGSQLLVQTSADGRLLVWDPATPSTLLVRVSTSPLGRGFVVTPERFVVMFGMLDNVTGSSRRYGWCDEEDYTDWDFTSVSNKAGFFDIEPASPIVTAMSGKSGILMFTSTKVFQLSFTGLPYIYSQTELAENCTPWSPASIVATSSVIMWMSQQGLWVFDGTSVVPIPFPIRSWVDDDIDLLYVRAVACAVHVSTFNEFWWFFPQEGSTKNTRAAIYNYREGWCSQARMQRSAGITSSYLSRPVMANELIAYAHETGLSYGDADLPWVETFELNVTSGSRLMTVKQIIPDIESDVNVPEGISQLRYSLFFRNSRSIGTAEQQSSLKQVRSNGYVDFRTTGRDVRLRIEVSGPVVYPFVVGQHLVDVVPRGDR